MKFQKFVYLSSSKTQLLMVAESGEKGKESGIVEAAGPLLRYLAELMRALKYSSEKECPPSPSLCPVDGESLLQDVESDWMDDMGGDDEDSGGEESVSEKRKLGSIVIGSYSCFLCPMKSRQFIVRCFVDPYFFYGPVQLASLGVEIF